MKELTLEERIRKKAYELWQQDGSMEGCADEYWRQAREIVEQEMLEEKSRSPCVGSEHRTLTCSAFELKINAKLL
ncbi:hypothetical protein AWB81_08583 [Caballeronia arationis]|jgi:hypothetical protein|uniref:DUF2934 domain-containing protein n=1 Tax=Caballeronia arationis TaxID=1777142 RepID=A0A7Z7I2L2_9BURK|nr:DUF2934 domain-containing protein [Caballeronia arationis]SAL08089.1 hypothetical protein AWB81_08583 [Caballeronia arationis]SOE52800.1 Protein of unknown function [Caballeronia arationis]